MSSGVVKNNFSVILEENIPSFKPSNFYGNVPNGFFKQHLGKGKKHYLELLTKIRSILTNYPELPIKQKKDYCCIERYLMKKYLKKVVVKLK
jgi:hypothetical protein